MKQLLDAPLYRWVACCTRQCYIRLKKLFREKHSSLLVAVLSDGEGRFCVIDSLVGNATHQNETKENVTQIFENGIFKETILTTILWRFTKLLAKFLDMEVLLNNSQ